MEKGIVCCFHKGNSFKEYRKLKNGWGDDLYCSLLKTFSISMRNISWQSCWKEKSGNTEKNC